MKAVGQNWNPQLNCTVKPGDIAPSLMRVNVIANTPVWQIVRNLSDAGHEVILLCHAQMVPGTDWWIDWEKHKTEYLASLTDVCEVVKYSTVNVVAIEGWNEGNNWRPNTQRPELTIAQYREITVATGAICKQYGIPFISGPMFTHDQANGLEYISNEVKNACDYLGLHLYQTSISRMVQMARLWKVEGKPIVVTEVGFQNTPAGELRKTLYNLLPIIPNVVWFCLQSWDKEQWGIVDNGGSPNHLLAEYNAEAKDYNVAQEAPEETPVADAKLHITFAPSIQNNRPYPKPGDGDYAEDEGTFATWFCGSKLLQLAKAKGWETHVDQATYTPGDDLGPLYAQRARIIARAKANPQTKYLIVSIHTEGTLHEPNLFGGRYFGANSQKLLSAIDDQLVKVHPKGAWRFEYDSATYILLDGYPANCVCAIVEVAGDSTIAKVKFLSTAADTLPPQRPRRRQ
jgi:hypothetical protein